MSSYDSGWIRRDNGSTLSLPTTGRHLLTATLQFRGVQRTFARSNDNRDPTTSSYIQSSGSYNHSMPSIPSGSHITPTGQKLTFTCGGWLASRSGTITIGGRTYSVSVSNTSTVSRSGEYSTNASTRPYSFNFDGSVAWNVRGYSYYNETLQTQSPSANVNGTSYTSATISNGSTSSVFNILSAMNSNGANSFAFSSSGSGYCEVRIIYTYATLPAVTTQDATNIAPYTATISGNLTSVGFADTTRYMRYRKVGDPDWIVINNGVGGVGIYNANLSGLEVTETYEFQAYASNASQPTLGIAYGAIKNFTTVAAAPTVQSLPATNISYVSTTLNGNLTFDGGAETTVFFEYGKTPSYELGAINKGILASGAFSHALSGIDYETLYYYRAYATNVPGRTNGAQQTFTTLYPYLPAPTDRDPANGERTDSDKPTFTFTLGGGDVELINPATKYHARIRFSQYVGMTPLIAEYQTTVSLTGWEYYDGLAWQAFPAGGVDPGTIVRYTPAVGLPFGPVYWDVASYDGSRYGINSTVRVIRILLTVEGAYTLSIDGNLWEVYNDLKVVETANGELGTIEFSVKRDDLNPINYGDQVILALRDWRAQTEEFVGRVRRLDPVGSMIRVNAILGDGYLGERRIKTDYPTDTVAETITAFADNLDGKTKVTSTAHSLSNGDKVLIECDVNDYNGVWTVEQKAVNDYVIDVTYSSTGTGTGKPVADIGVYVKAIIDTYCAPITANDGNTYVDTATGFIAPIKAKDKTAVRVLEEIRRNYGYYYFVDRDNYFHFYPPTDVIVPDITIKIRRGDLT